MKLQKTIHITKILLTLGALEFFGPILRDTNSSHLLNPEWVGHARFHLMWCISLWGCLGIYSIYLLWGKSETNTTTLFQVFFFQVMNAIAFWVSVSIGGFYGADVFDEKIHVGIMNVNENVAVFSLMSVLLIVTYIVLSKAVKQELSESKK